MTSTITAFHCASALGNENSEAYANYLNGFAPGMRETSGDIPGRSIFFGHVTAALPAIAEKRWDMRTNALLEFSYAHLKEYVEALKRKYGKDRIAVILGASNTGIDEAQNYVDDWLDSGEKPDKMDFSMIELGTPSLYLQSLAGTTGAAYTISTACSSATKAFGAAARLLESGVCDAVITGGVDGRCRFAMNGFNALGALSEGRCRPLSKDRDGINLGEAVALFTLEKVGEGPKVLSIGESSDAYHATAPDPEGNGAEAAMRDALDKAGLTPSDIDYINLHGTGTQANDSMELKAVQRVFGSTPPFYESTKSLTGHCLGAAGAIEAAICAMRIMAKTSRVAISNSFAFGGSNASIIISA